MSFATSVVETVEGLLAYFGGKLKQNLADYIDIESVDDESTLTLKDGTLLTVIQLHGSFRMIGEQEFSDCDSLISKSLKAYLNNGGHAIHVYFSGDPDNAASDIEKAIEPSRATARRLGLALDDLFEEDVKHLSKFCTKEKGYLTLLTRPSAVTSAEQKRDIKAKMELFEAHPLPRMRDVPNVFAALQSLRTRHKSFVDAMISDLKEVFISAEVLDVHAAGREMRSSVDPDFTADEWRPVLPGDKIPVRAVRRDPKDMSGAYWPRLDRQLSPRDAKKLGRKYLTVGDRIYAPMYIHLHPSEIKPFQQLFLRVGESRLPWRISFLIESGGLAMVGFKNMIAAIVGFTNPDNRLFRDAVQAVRDMVKHQDALDVRLRVDFATWAPAGEEKLLATRASRLARAVQGWGGADVREVSGDQFQGFISTALCLSLNSVATPACAILGDVTNMLPFYRPASPWADGGAVLYRTPDGKIWPYQPNSPVQSSWITCAVAEPRSGKTVNGNLVNLALCLSPGITRIPMIGIVDVGKGSAGLISLLQHALPEGSRHLAVSIRLRMTPEFAINPLDTQPGSRFLLPSEFAFVTNFLSLLVTPMGASAPADGMVGLVKFTIQEAYRFYSGDGNNSRAKPYTRNTSGAELVDAAIDRYGITVDRRTTWWEIVDSLFDMGDLHASVLAQRQAVPTLADIAAVSREQQFVDLYGNKKTEDGEPLLDAFSRMMSESIRSYPILALPTAFDLGEARVVSLDLAEVAKSGSAAADHQTAMCYMLARYVVARNFYLTEEDVGFFDKRYRPYHEKRISEIRQDKKHLQWDELHRTKKIRPVRDQVIGDMREGGKEGIMVTVISQDVDDFDDEMLSFATCKIILSKQNEVKATKMRKMFSLTPTAEYAVRHLIRPPSAKGSTFVGMFTTREGDAVHLLNNTMGGIKLWAFSTTQEDAYVRDTLYKQIGPVETRRLLSKLYPGGSITREVESRKKRVELSGLIGADKDDGVIDGLVAEILQTYHETQKAALR
ncbi:type IV secretion protein IcmB [Pseudomonas sp. WS 5532]|uniref:type IV secretion protein IcmB n=1 Tax=Pseudomonas sp. WS 5532 TaxID=2717495 RepID=UPI00147321BD|nr:type IV secretion protein IcmB [Pseudomonas sp. WS 5532]NMX77604.1 type IV secretion protein IcmB [Pseudomonas sp. WS 5532]